MISVNPLEFVASILNDPKPSADSSNKLIPVKESLLPSSDNVNDTSASSLVDIDKFVGELSEDTEINSLSPSWIPLDIVSVVTIQSP